MGFFGDTIVLRQLDYNGHQNTSYGIYDTFIVSFSRYSEFKRIMTQRPIDERSKIVARSFVAHDIVFYADEKGAVSKHQIEAE
jgi:hypothetical protein